MSSTLRITAPSRLHFGLLRFAQQNGPSYGGLGMMLDRPATVVDLKLSDTWQATGPNAERTLDFAEQAIAYWSIPSKAAYSIQVQQAPPAHSGLGSGTQLALAIAQGIHHLTNKQPVFADSLAASVGRGRRSAIGSHGFLQGGLLWETGRVPNESLAKLTRRLEVPKAWRVLLITPPHDVGLHGLSESDAFAKLPAVPTEVTEQLQHLAESQILPAVEHADFDKFSDSLYHYGHLAGSCFATIQGGPYASPAIAKGIEKLRTFGIKGVGQSSWGPTIYAFAPDQATADHQMAQLIEQPEFAECQITVATPSNQGAQVDSL